MPRTARVAFENGFFHVYNCSKDKETLFKEEEDYKKFLLKLQALTADDNFDHIVYGYILLPNLFHILVQTNSVPLSRIMSSLLTSYSMHYNLKYKHKGSVFYDRFKSKLTTPETYLKGALRFIHLLPVSEGIVSNFKSYLYSSYNELIGKSEFKIIDKQEVYSVIGDTPFKIDKYDKFLTEGLPIIKDLSSHYNFSRQIEADPKFSTFADRQFKREQFKRKIEGWFKIRLD